MMLSIPGTSSVEHPLQNAASSSLCLSEEEYEQLAAVPEPEGSRTEN
jgi:diketogulonate reductase-like aldo/keto reductase